VAPREALVALWYEIAINTIGPWEIELQNNETRNFHALTMIDTVTNFVEMQRVNSTSAQDAANAFEMNWLFKYPQPVRVIHDQGTEFMGDISNRYWDDGEYETHQLALGILKRLRCANECIKQ
jgi:hypothetical protein